MHVCLHKNKFWASTFARFNSCAWIFDIRFEVLYHVHVNAQHVLSRAKKVTVTALHAGIHTVLGGQREAYIGTAQSLESDLSPHRPFLGVYICNRLSQYIYVISLRRARGAGCVRGDVLSIQPLRAASEDSRSTRGVSPRHPTICLRRTRGDGVRRCECA